MLRRIGLLLFWGASYRKKFRQKRRDGKRQRTEKKKEDPGHEQVGRPRNMVFFQWSVAPEGRKVGLLRRWMRSHLARWEMKSCMPMWPEAHFQGKRVQYWWSRTTFGSWEVEKVHAVVARSTCPSQKWTNWGGSEHFWGFGCWFAWQSPGILHLAKAEKKLEFRISFNYNPHYTIQLQL